VAMSGGVDSSVAAALLVAQGHEVTGATLKLWGGPGDSGCCSVADVDDARRVADRLGIPHRVWNYAEDFEARVVAPYVAAHAAGRTPNPCIECNRHLKFGLLLERAVRLGFDALATGHHARVSGPLGTDARRLRRGADRAKDQSYVLAPLRPDQLRCLTLPVGELTKAQVRAEALRLGLATADKPDSYEVCFIHSGEGRAGFVGQRVALHPGTIVDGATGAELGTVSAIELVTVGQRRGLGSAQVGRRYALAVDVARRRVVVGDRAAAATREVRVGDEVWSRSLPATGRALAQTSAHGPAAPCTVRNGMVVFDEPHRLVAPGQTVAFYDLDDPDAVLGAAVAS